MPRRRLPGTAAIRVLLVDSSRISSQAISAALKRDHFEIVYAGCDPSEAMAEVSRTRPDIALISAELNDHGLTGRDLAEKLRDTQPKTRVVMLVERPDRESVVAGFRAGSRGVFPRSSSLEVLSKCIACVHQGQVWASNSDMEHVLSALRMPLRIVDANGTNLLSKRERDVVRWVSEGLKNGEIADRLGLKENTIKNYLFRIFDKLGISSRVELILYAVSQLVQRPPEIQIQDPAQTFQDEAAMFRWCREAAERFIVAQYVLGELYRDGRGVPRDLEAAHMWFSIAEKVSADMESKSGQAKRALESALGPQLVHQSTRNAAEWLRRQRQLSTVHIEVNPIVSAA